MACLGESQTRPPVKLRYVVGIDDPHNISQFHTGAGLASVDTQPFLCENAWIGRNAWSDALILL